MSKQKYKFDPELLSYTPESKNQLVHFSRVFVTVLFAALVLAILLFMSASSFFISSKARKIKTENDQLRLQYALLEEKMLLIDSALDNLQKRDRSIYKAIFETDTVPFAKKTAQEAEDENLDINSYVIKNSYMSKMLVRKERYQKKEYRKVLEMLKNKIDTLNDMPAILPMPDNEDVQLVAGFGIRLNPMLKIAKQHNGLDFTAPAGTKVYATADGVVKSDGRKRGYGLRVVIKHKNKYQSVYAHLAEKYVRKGEKVKRGDLIGHIGKTSITTIPHLHYEVLYDKKYVDPLDYMFLEVNAKKYNDLEKQMEFSNQSLD